MDCSACTPRPWELPFLAVPEEVAALRRLLRLHLALWGLQELTEAAQLCVSELVANVITHVGPGTPTTLAVSMRGTHLRIEVHDPATRALPTLVDPTDDAETGRGMALVAGISDRWGVQLLPDSKVTWVELASAPAASNGHSDNVRVSRAASLLHVYRGEWPAPPLGASRLSVVTTQAVAIGVMADFLHWARAHGHDADEVMDRAQMQFEADME